MSNYITTTHRSLLQPSAFQGLLVCNHHAQITARLRTQLGEPYAAIFAEPMFDIVQERIDWYTSYPGSIKTFQQLSASEQEGIQTNLMQCGERILALAAQLKSMPDNANQLAGNIIELALTIPDKNCIYSIDNQAVLVAWGCASSNSTNVPCEITRFTLSPVTQSACSSPVPPPIPQTPPSRVWSWWWLLPVFFLLLFCALFFFKGPLAAFFTPSLDAELAGMTAKRDALKHELVMRAEECPKKPLTIPENATKDDMAFLAGHWRCDTSLVSKRTGKIAVVEYSFNKQGKGSITIDSEKGLCTAKANATLLDADTLSIVTEDVIVCPEGMSYVGQSITCRRDGAQVRCQGLNQRSASPWDAQFYRLAEVKP